MKLLLGGSPCTFWSVAQTKNRETKPEGIGWELFKNYLIALEKFKPDFFLYENNKSMSAAIREQITKELGVEPIPINSALVSAQNRQRLYWTNIPGVGQPEDRGILLRDILESGVVWNEKAYALKANYTNASPANAVCSQHFPSPMAAEPVRIGSIESAAESRNTSSRPYRVYSPDGKSVTLSSTDGGTGSTTGLYATPVRVGDMPNASGTVSGSQSGRIYSVDGKGVPLQARPNGGGADGAATGLYAVPAGMAWRGRGESSPYEIRDDQKANSVTVAGYQSRLVIEAADGKTYPVYEVRDGQITIKGKQYPIKLADGFYIIRKLTVTECKRLQTVPEEYEFNEKLLYKQIFYGGIDNCPDAESKVVIAKSGTIVQDYAICTTFDIQDTGQQISQETMLTTVKSALLKAVKESGKQTSAIVLCTTNDLGGMGQQSCLSESLQNVKFVVNQRLQEDCVLVTMQATENTETQDVLIYAEMLLHPEDIKKGHTKIIRLNIEKLRQKLSVDHLHQKILSTILTAINQIMMRVTFTYVQQANTVNYTVNLKNVRQNYFELDILNLTVESTKPISDTQAYRMLGNGWTVDVIAHILHYAPGITTEPLEVLSMYDGMSCGRLALNKLGAKVVRYRATEIDKYAIKTTQANFPDTIQLGDAFQVREEGWHV